MGIQINVLPVGKGDCIHIRFFDDMGYHNIVIDSGNEASAKLFQNLLFSLKSSGEVIDLMCFTHIDDDHIAGAKKVFSQPHMNWGFIKSIWFNHIPSSGKSRFLHQSSAFLTLSAKSADELIGYLKSYKLNIISGIAEGYRTIIGRSEITVLTPTKKRLLSQGMSSQTFHRLSSHADSSKANAVCIAFLLRYNNKIFLFSGDAFAVDLTKTLKEYAAAESVYFTKLSHHGSERNLSPKLLEQMKAMRFIISSDGSEKFPSDETIQMIENYRPELRKHLLCNFKLKRCIHHPTKLKVTDLTQKPYEEPGITIISKAVESCQ